MRPHRIRVRTRRVVAAAAGIALVLVLAPLLGGCAVLVEPLPDLRPAVGGEPGTFDHGDLDRVLRRFVDERGNVDYAGLEAEPEALERYYAAIAAVSPDSHPDRFPDENSRFAYWLNAYNGAVLTSVTRLYPLASVSDVGVPWYLFWLPGNAGFFYYREQLFGGDAKSLYEVENSVVRERFPDPRSHFALNCASGGCPRLPAAAFRPATLEQELEREARQFFSESRNLTVDHAAGVVRLSQILEWYESDFTDWLATHGQPDGTLLDYAARYAPAPIAAALRGRARAYRVEFVPYDWRLNDRGLSR